MDIVQFRCRHCHTIHRQGVVGQRYCGSPACQRARKNAWRREHYATDKEYRLTARDSTRAWLTAHGGASKYYKEYRQRQNRQKQTEPSHQTNQTEDRAIKGVRLPEASQPVFMQKTTTPQGANSDAKTAQGIVNNGEYLLFPQGGANSDAILVKLFVIKEETERLQRTTC